MREMKILAFAAVLALVAPAWAYTVSGDTMVTNGGDWVRTTYTSNGINGETDIGLPLPAMEDIQIAEGEWMTGWSTGYHVIGGSIPAGGAKWQGNTSCMLQFGFIGRDNLELAFDNNSAFPGIFNKTITALAFYANSGPLYQMTTRVMGSTDTNRYTYNADLPIEWELFWYGTDQGTLANKTGYRVKNQVTGVWEDHFRNRTDFPANVGQFAGEFCFVIQGVDWSASLPERYSAFNNTYVPIPEPATMGLLALVGLGVLARRRRS